MKNFFKNKDIFDIALIVIIALLFMFSAKIIVKKITKYNKIHKDSIKLETFKISNVRKKDHGFNFKIDDCLTSDDKDYIVIDIDQKNMYVFANAEQYYNGPFPITEKTLIKENALLFDKKKNNKNVSCNELSKKYSNQKN